MRRRLIAGMGAMVACVALLALPASAFAGAYTWSQPSDVTTASQYGVQSWSYSDGSALTFSSGFTGNGKTLAGYKNAGTTDWIATPTTGTSRPLEMVPASAGSVTLTWTNPFASQQTVSVSGSVTVPNASVICGTTWSLVSGANTIDPGTSPTIGPTQVSVPAGGTIVLHVADASLSSLTYSTTCDETDVNLSVSIAATPPAPTITAPTANQQFTGTQPTFSGGASDGFGYNPQLTVKVFSGASVVQTLHPTESAGHWSIAPSTLTNGTYTVTAEQTDLAGDDVTTSPVSFTIAGTTPPPPPTVTLYSFGSAPLTTATPTFSGTAGTDPGDSNVQVRVFNNSNGTVETVSTAVNSDGNWSVQASPPLANGTYTAIAGQFGPGQSSPSLSTVITFTISAIAPTGTLTLDRPNAGASVEEAALVFGGSAANASGDSSTIKVALWKGGAARGTPYGTTTATSNGSTWTTTWPRRLPLGYYTVEASQQTTGGTATTPPHTFLVVPTVGVIGNTVTLSRSRQASVAVTCKAPSGQVCTGTVLVVTSASYQPAAGGPKGAIVLIYARVSVPAGNTTVVRGSVSSRVWRTLKHKSHVKLSVSALGITTSRTLNVQ